MSPCGSILDGDALAANWRWLAARSGGAACGAAVKADGYGLGAREDGERLQAAGCRDFFVATWAEAEALTPWPGDLDLSRAARRPAPRTWRRRSARRRGRC